MSAVVTKQPCRIACLGSLPASYRCLDYLLRTVPGANVVAVIPHTSGAAGRPDQDVQRLAAEHNIPVLTFAELAAVEFDLGISLLFDAKIPADLVNRPANGFLNLHLGPLPRFRGSNSVLHALRLAREENHWMFGVTLMYMDEHLDTGPIIEVLDVPIFPDDTAQTLHARAMDAVPVLFARHIRSIVAAEGRVAAKRQEGPSHFFRRGIVDHEINLEWDPDRVYDMVRALSFAGKPRPFIRLGKHKFFITLEERS
jgi:methionyl-tRNA formyltransferase